MKRTLVVGVDGSPESRTAADWAAREAVRRDLRVHVVHAWLWQPLAVPVVQDRAVEARRAREILEETEAELTRRHPTLALTAEVVPDVPVPALLRAAKEAEMLVLGSRGYGAVAGFLLGSYGQQLIAAAECPVVSVRAGRGGPVSAADGAEVVVGQQGGVEESADVLRFAFEAAAAHGAPLRAVRAWSLPPVYGYSPGSLWVANQLGGLEPFEKDALEQALEPWRSRYPEVDVVAHVEQGSAGHALLSAASDARLLVVGRRVRDSVLGTRIGSVAHAVLHHAACPVAVVPHR
ncbi:MULTISPECIES: universal stress protein [Streptomyces]|uniref:Universal stress protein UspA n=1 Tax=Streptomyces amritsarensis TaxID=681158 RepID=A0ABX3G2T6_9ACTN|nr:MULTISPECIES: universal stress protein [Streptomyces]AQT70659.1 universal stress protein UspA [Streptomyces sp. fd1-xmd]MDX6757970.1 universal stress protein [Streptomyces sp. F8]OLZ67051.1 universal stress protein UspA [Streptomyces amritsarensis]